MKAGADIKDVGHVKDLSGLDKDGLPTSRWSALCIRAGDISRPIVHHPNFYSCLVPFPPSNGPRLRRSRDAAPDRWRTSGRRWLAATSSEVSHWMTPRCPTPADVSTEHSRAKTLPSFRHLVSLGRGLALMEESCFVADLATQGSAY